jgi:hypothetical protein
MITFFFPVKGCVLPVPVEYEVNWAPGPIFNVIEKLTRVKIHVRSEVVTAVAVKFCEC